MSTRRRQVWGRSGAGLGLVAALLGACTGDPSRPLLAPDEAFLAKGAGGGVSVTAASPPYGYQGQVAKQVTVTGSGFAAGAVASWERNGAADPKVTVLSTQYVSSSQLIATITIAGDADIALYDIGVTLPGNKKGIGTAMFEITTAEVLGTIGSTSSYVNDMSPQGLIVGYNSGNSAIAYADGAGVHAVGTGQAWGTDPLGTMVLGRDLNFKATAWVKQANGSYVAELLPNPGAGGSIVQSGARDASGTLFVAGADGLRVTKNTHLNRPAVWTRTGTSWSQPVLYAMPGDRANIRDINSSGTAVGQYNACCGIVWNSPTDYVTLDGVPEAINDAGTLMVGSRNETAVYWTRTISGSWNPVGYALPNVGSGCTGGFARDVNNDGVIVGHTCSGNKRLATVWRLDMSGSLPVLVGGATALPGLGNNGTEASVAVGVSRAAPYVAAGTAQLSWKNVVVRWVLP